MNILQALGGIVMSLMFAGASVAVFVIVERVFPAHRLSRACQALNLGLVIVTTLLSALVSPVLGIGTALATNALGGGFLRLPSTGISLVGSILVYAFTRDLFEYAFHRAQHSVPWLWRMHSLHHSEPEFNSTTAFRMFWLEPILKSVSTYFVLGIIFKATPMIVIIVTGIGFYNIFVHANLKVQFGRLSWLLVSPAYHRIHHSMRTEDFNSNFTPMFPLIDILFGTYKKPVPGVYPETGLIANGPRVTLAQAIMWPVANVAYHTLGEPERLSEPLVLREAA